ncbi:hypothetical protein ACFOU2_09650 [Bacillus songklensis]|uniref:Uncharacterized protein n=1 Tax=Bacillus songklensis TaxID=1069116 RepID=A0ABV8B2I6_9BACI
MKAFINGVEARYVLNSLSLNDDTGKRSTGSIKFIRENGLAIKSGAKVDIYDVEGSHIFGGFAKKPKIKSYRGLSVIQVQLVDNTDIANRRIVAETYVDWVDHDIVKDIHERYLKEDGIKLGVIASNSGDATTETKIETTKADFMSGVLSGVEIDDGGTMTLENISDNPPISRVVEDFEDITYNFNFNGTWERSSFRAYQGTYGFRSDSIDHRESSMSDFDITVREGAIGKLSFFYWVSSEKNEDFFEVWATKDDVQTLLLKASGIDETWRYFSKTLDPGSYKITFIYDKDKSVDRGYDRALVDQIVFEEWEGLVYPSQGERIAPKITSTSDAIKTIRIEWDGETPAGTSVEFYYSLDDQETWELAADNVIRRSVNGAVGVDVKTVLKTSDTTKTPAIKEIRYVLETTAGTHIRKAVFNYVKASQAFDEICELSGAVWWVTSDKVLHYVARDEFKAPWSITPEHSPTQNFEVETDLSEYRNRQYLRAGQDITDLQTESMKGDGSKRTFPVGYKIAQRPVVFLNEVEQTVGIRQVDKNKAFYWSKNEKEITQDENATPLSSTDILRVEYYGFYPIIVVAEDAEAIEEMKARTGDTGLYEDVEENENIDDSDLALEFANSKLQKYAKINTRIRFDTVKKGLQAGQLLPINRPDYDVNDEFLITSVEIKPFNDDFILYSIECVDGDDVGGWENFFKQLARSQKTYVIRENEVLIRLATQLERVGFAEEMSYKPFACKFPGYDVYPSNTFIPC